MLQDLVEGEALTATVVPARVDGCYTITLLELLYQHWEKAGPGRGYESHVLDPTRRNAKREKVYNAEIESPPNEFGFVTATLRHQDVARGIKHRFSFNVLQRNSGDQDGDAAVSQAEAPPPIDYPTPVFLHLARDYAQLDVGDLDLDALESIEKSEAGGLKLIDAQGSGDPGRDDADEQGEDSVRYAAPGAVLRSVSDKPVSRKAVAALAALDESASWQNDVWAFWARSHHLQVDRKSPYLPGTASDVFDVRSEVDLSSEDETNAERLRRVVAEYLRDHPVNTVVEAEVEQITDSSVFVRLQDGLEGRVPVSELSWGFTEHASEEVHAGKTLRLLITDATEDPPRLTLSVRALLPKPYDEYKARHNVGDKVGVEVDRVSKSHVNVHHSNGAPGVIHVSNLRWERVEDATDVYKPGDKVNAVILDFDDDKEQLELSIKALLLEPYQAYKAKHSVGDQVRAVVDRVSESHVNVRHSNGAPGVIHVSNLRWERVNDATRLYKPGDEVKAQILKFDDNKRQTELSIKAALPDPLTTFAATHRPNDTVRGTVTKILPKNAFVDLGGGVAGSIFIRHLTGGPLASFDGQLREGQVYDFRILEYDLERKQVKLARFGLATSAGHLSPPAPRSSAQQAVPSPRPQQRVSSAPSPRTPRSTTAEGDSVDEAAANGCRVLGLKAAQVRVEVLDAGERGLFGRVKRRARVRVTERI